MNDRQKTMIGAAIIIIILLLLVGAYAMSGSKNNTTATPTPTPAPTLSPTLTPTPVAQGSASTGTGSATPTATPAPIATPTPKPTSAFGVEPGNSVWPLYNYHWSVTATPTVTITMGGTVYDGDDNPLPEATVTLTYGGVAHTTTSNSVGIFSFSGVPVGIAFTMYATYGEYQWDGKISDITPAVDKTDYELWVDYEPSPSPTPTSGLAASYVSCVDAQVLSTDENIPISVTWLNSGTVAWTSDEGIYMAMGGDSFYLPNGVTVQPGEEYTFTTTIPNWPDGVFPQGFSSYPVSSFFSCTIDQGDTLIGGDNNWGPQNFIITKGPDD